jgi:hypothetical protein
MSMSIYIEDYSAKSFVVRGETRSYMESLKAMGGKWNSSLTDKETGERFGAWLFWSAKRKEIDEWFRNGCLEVKRKSVVDRSVVDRSVVDRSVVDRSVVNKDLIIKNLERKVEELTHLINDICRINNLVTEPRKEHEINQQVVYEEDGDEVVVPKQHKRLLRK